MINIIKDTRGNILIAEPVDKLIIERADGSMIGVENYHEATAVICGEEYLDCECAETEWHMRLAAAKQVGLAIISEEEGAKVIVYDERIGKMPYSYTDANPDYDIPKDPEVIRIETEESLVLSLAQINHLRVWIKTEEDYKNILRKIDVNGRLEEIAESFSDKLTPIPLHQRLK